MKRAAAGTGSPGDQRIILDRTTRIWGIPSESGCTSSSEAARIYYTKAHHAGQFSCGASLR
jgi:hypothetical protein